VRSHGWPFRAVDASSSSTLNWRGFRNSVLFEGDDYIYARATLCASPARIRLVADAAGCFILPPFRRQVESLESKARQAEREAGQTEAGIMTSKASTISGQTIAVVAIFAFPLGISEFCRQNRQSQKQMGRANRLARGAAQQAQVDESFSQIQKASFRDTGDGRHSGGRGMIDLASLDNEERNPLRLFLEYVLRELEAHVSSATCAASFDEELLGAHLRKRASAMKRPGILCGLEQRSLRFRKRSANFCEANSSHSPEGSR